MFQADAKHDFAVKVVRRLQGAGYQALWAGGCVRDVLLGRKPQDYDVATDARPDAVRKLFGHRSTLAVGASFGVIIVIGTKATGNVEVATFRTEGPYFDGRRPEHVVFSTPQQDAARRDFTINGIFYDPVAAKVHDYVGGEKDLAARRVRAIGRPAERMEEDKLRLLRGVRIAAALEFDLEVETADAIRGMASQIHVVSAERIAQELRKMLVDSHRARAIQLAHELGLLLQILPEVAAVSHDSADSWSATLRRLDWLREPDFKLSFAALLRDVPEAPRTSLAISQRLKLSNEESDTIEWLLGHVDQMADAPQWSLARLKRLLADPRASHLLELAQADAIARGCDPSAVLYCREFLAKTPPEELSPPPLITGDDLIEVGLRPGKAFRQILDGVRDAQLNGEITTAEEGLRLAKELQVRFNGPSLNP